MIIKATQKVIGSIPNAALTIGVVLARTPLPNLPIVNVGFARGVPVAQESTGDQRDRVLVVSNASEPVNELGVDIVCEVFISDLRGRGVRFPRVQVQETFALMRTRGSP
jgi:hypothetical protein